MQGGLAQRRHHHRIETHRDLFELHIDHSRRAHGPLHLRAPDGPELQHLTGHRANGVRAVAPRPGCGTRPFDDDGDVGERRAALVGHRAGDGLLLRDDARSDEEDSHQPHEDTTSHG